MVFPAGFEPRIRASEAGVRPGTLRSVLIGPFSAPTS